MILSNTEIKKWIQSGEIFIGSDSETPVSIDALKFDTTSVDVTLAPEIFCWKNIKGVVIDPAEENFSYKKFSKKNTYIESCEDGFIIQPGEFILATTKEYIKLSKKVCARVEGRSSLGRLGISIHVTAPTVHSVSEGNITLEIFNHSQFDVKITAGMRICQLIFEEVLGEVIVGERTFAKQSSPTG